MRQPGSLSVDAIQPPKDWQKPVSKSGRASCGAKMQTDLAELLVFVVLIGVAIWLSCRAVRVRSSYWKKGPP